MIRLVERSTIAAFGALLAVLFPQTLGAQTSGADRPSTSIYHLQVENDAFNSAGGDRSYTQGLRITREWAPRNAAAVHPWVIRLSGLRFHAGTEACADSTRRFAEDATGCLRLSVGAYQTMFTPDSIRLTTPPADQRPYAGVAGIALRSTVIRGRVSDIRELRLGVLGPASNAEATQNLAHWSFSASAGKVNGWATQIRNYPDLSLRQIVRVQPLRACWGSWRDSNCDLDGGPRLFDVSFGYDAFVGTTGVRLGLMPMVRLGYNIDEASYPDRESPTLYGKMQLYRQPGDTSAAGVLSAKARAAKAVQSWRDRWYSKFSAYFVAEFHHRWVPYNALLSGTPTDRRSNVDPYSTVAEASVGLAVRLQRLSVFLLNVSRTPEFPGDAGQPYSTVRISWRP